VSRGNKHAIDALLQHGSKQTCNCATKWKKNETKARQLGSVPNWMSFIPNSFTYF
jgi:hypothetical protein